MKILHGAMVFLGADGAGLPVLPDRLPETINPVILELFSGSEAGLREAVDRTVAELRRAGYRIRSQSVEEHRRLGWARAHWTAVIEGEV